MVEGTASIVNEDVFPKLYEESYLYTTPLFKNEMFLRQKYEVERLSARQIAVLISCSHDAVNRALKEFRIKITKHHAGWVPFGYKRKDGKIVEHVRQQILIKKMSSWKSKGWSYRKIALELNKLKIKTSGCRGQWYATTVKKALKTKILSINS